ncbi:hypothetical protein PINS_up022171 [Pythium insidiosum]|nr:hypothetical protein PINS_up022171 [Pythium insidiosum]
MAVFPRSACSSLGSQAWIAQPSTAKAARSTAFRRAWWWDSFRDYFPLSLRQEDEFDPAKRLPTAAGLSRKNRDLDVALATVACFYIFAVVNVNFFLPFWREILFAVGILDASFKSLQAGLRRNRSIAVVVGECSRGASCPPGTCDIILNKRKGIIRLALNTGTPLGSQPQGITSLRAAKAVPQVLQVLAPEFLSAPGCLAALSACFRIACRFKWLLEPDSCAITIECPTDEDVLKYQAIYRSELEKTPTPSMRRTTTSTFFHRRCDRQNHQSFVSWLLRQIPNVNQSSIFPLTLRESSFGWLGHLEIWDDSAVVAQINHNPREVDRLTFGTCNGSTSTPDTQKPSSNWWTSTSTPTPKFSFSDDYFARPSRHHPLRQATTKFTINVKSLKFVATNGSSSDDITPDDSSFNQDARAFHCCSTTTAKPSGTPAASTAAPNAATNATTAPRTTAPAPTAGAGASTGGSGGANTSGQRTNPLVIKGPRIFDSVTGQYFGVRGVDYYPRPNGGPLNVNNYDFFTAEFKHVWGRDVPQFSALNANTIRLYAVDPDGDHTEFMCALQAAGIYVVVDLASSCPGCEVTADAAPACYPASYKERGQKIISNFAKYDNVLGFSGGNEINHRTQGNPPKWNAPCQKKFIRDMRAYIKSCPEMRQIPVGLVIADTYRDWNAMYYNCRTDPNDELETAEWFGINVYPDSTCSATASRASNYSIPTLLTEFGCLSPAFPTVDGYEGQRTFHDAKWMNDREYSDVFNGGMVFEYSTELANSQSTSAFPFKKVGPQNYGLGYLSPENCDEVNIPCEFIRFPNFDNLAKAYGATDTSTSRRCSHLWCHPIGHSRRLLSEFTWVSDGKTNLVCPPKSTFQCPNVGSLPPAPTPTAGGSKRPAANSSTTVPSFAGNSTSKPSSTPSKTTKETGFSISNTFGEAIDVAVYEGASAIHPETEEAPPSPQDPIIESPKPTHKPNGTKNGTNSTINKPRSRHSAAPAAWNVGGVASVVVTAACLLVAFV